MSASSRSFPERERAELADLLEAVGPDAPTHCGDWTTAQLAAHIVVRDRRPDALAGYGLEEAGIGGPLAAWSHRQEDRLRASTPYAEVVARLRAGPPRWSLLAVPRLGTLLNTAEFAIHHEDVRRAQPDWQPRDLSPAVQDQLWSSSAFYARRAAGRRGLVMRRTDAPGVERRLGNAGRTVAGDPMELLLWVAGRRDVARVSTS
jgi:uncharacterized protein (TIGR03085 family)